jgi:hypothetical protein
MNIEEARRLVDEDRRSRMSEEGALLDRVLSAVERVANEIPPPSRQAAELFNIVVAARAFHEETRKGGPKPQPHLTYAVKYSRKEHGP